MEILACFTGVRMGAVARKKGRKRGGDEWMKGVRGQIVYEALERRV